MLPIAAVVVVIVFALAVARAGAASGNADDMSHPSTDPIVSPGVKDLAQAIARAEGFGVPGAIPTRAHNPGDLVIPGWQGETLGSEGVAVFASDADGWRALWRQLQRMADDRSTVYSLDDALGDVGRKWTGGDNPTAWTANVVAVLTARGYDADEWTTLRDLFAVSV